MKGFMESNILYQELAASIETVVKLVAGITAGEARCCSI